MRRLDAARGEIMTRRCAAAAAVTLMAAFTGAAGAAPPIHNPGAPGESGRALTAEQSVAMSRTGHTDADVRFMQHMIVHHGQAVEMVALIEDRNASPAVRRMGDRIARSQATEIEAMTGWLSVRDEPEDDPHLGHSGHGPHGGHDSHSDPGGHDGRSRSHHDEPADPGDVPLMPGMLSPNQMAALDAAEGEQFDRLFLEGMIAHHQGAIDMVGGLAADPDAAHDPFLSDFLSAVVSDQSAEILRMRSLLSELQ